MVPQITEINGITGESITRDMNDEEIAYIELVKQENNSLIFDGLVPLPESEVK